MSPIYINNMETYNNFISQFEIYESAPKKVKGFHRHHIVPEAVQRKLYGDVVDDRRVYVTPAQHLWLHILYDQENGTNTASRIISSSTLRKDDLKSYEDCLPLNDIDAEYIEMRTQVHTRYMQDSGFKPLSQQEEAKKEFVERVEKEQVLKLDNKQNQIEMRG